MSNCPNCRNKVNPFDLSLSAFPLYFRCPNCKIRLRVINSKLFWVTFCLYILIVIPMITYIPIIQEYNLGIILTVCSSLVIYQKISSYMLGKENLALYE